MYATPPCRPHTLRTPWTGSLHTVPTRLTDYSEYTYNTYHSLFFPTSFSSPRTRTMHVCFYRGVAYRGCARVYAPKICYFYPTKDEMYIEKTRRLPNQRNVTQYDDVRGIYSANIFVRFWTNVFSGLVIASFKLRPTSEHTNVYRINARSRYET